MFLPTLRHQQKKLSDAQSTMQEHTHTNTPYLEIFQPSICSVDEEKELHVTADM